MAGFSGLGNVFSASTLGGAQGTVGTTPAVRNSAGKLEAFDPATMAGTYKSPTEAVANLGMPSLPMDALTTGKPEYTSPGTPATGPMSAPYAPPAASTAGMPATQKLPAYAGGVGTAVQGSGTTPPTTAQPNYTLIPMNAPGGYNVPGVQQPMAIGDQWTGSGSVPMATPSKTANAPQLISNGIYIDNKGGYYAKDPSGKIVPLTGQSLTAAQNMFKTWGY